MPKCKNDETRSYTGNEPSPKGRGYCAHAEEVGKRRKGKDGKFWVVRETKRGNRWFRAIKSVRSPRRAKSPKGLPGPGPPPINRKNKPIHLRPKPPPFDIRNHLGPANIKLLSYNINNPQGKSKANIEKYIKERIAKDARSPDSFDIVALQESDNYDQYFQGFTKMFSTIQQPGYRNTLYINSVRWKTILERGEMLTYRPFLYTIISSRKNPGKTYLIINIHLCHIRGNKYAYLCKPEYTIDFVDMILGTIIKENPTDHVIILGDTNEYLNRTNNPAAKNLDDKVINFYKPDYNTNGNRRNPTCCQGNLAYRPDIVAISDSLASEYNLILRASRLPANNSEYSDHKPIIAELKRK